jgi:hypothetical protein
VHFRLSLWAALKKEGKVVVNACVFHSFSFRLRSNFQSVHQLDGVPFRS